MIKNPLLTVGMPTFNRADAAVERVHELVALQDEVGIRVLVVDNKSSDGTAHRIGREFADAGIELKVNESNVGFARNLLGVIRSARTPYVTLVSDEDRVEPEGLAALIGVLREQRPRLVSPRAGVRDDDAYRGVGETRPIKAEEFEAASFYMSGLTFDVARTRKDVALVEKLIPGNAAATFYPQVLLTALAILDDEGLFLDALVTRQVIELQTQISVPGPGAYWLVPSRWSQFEGYESFFRNWTEGMDDASARARRMRDKSRAGIFALLEDAAVKQFPELAEARRPTSFVHRVLGAIRG